MPLLEIPQNNLSGETPTQRDLDETVEAMETFFNVTKIDDYNLQDAGITGSTKLIDTSVTTAKLATPAATTAKINDAAVTTAKIDTSAVTTAKINDLAVTTAKILDAAVTTDKINANAVTRAKQASINLQASSTCTSYVGTGLSYADVTNLSVSITTAAGRPILLWLQPSGGVMSLVTTSSSNYTAKIKLLRGSTETGIWSYNIADTSFNTIPDALYVDSPGAGTFTYKIQANHNAATGSSTFNNLKLMALEL